MKIRRRFLQVGSRRVHYLRGGKGPPVVLVHSSPANAWFLLPEIKRLATEYTVFAFDPPGFGLSQALPMAEMQVSDLADALAETLAAIGMPPCPIFGSHTGAAIVLEFGVRHPGLTTGLVLDGVPAFTDAECAALFGDYFRDFPVTALGGHYTEVWTRFRDQSVWFPWSAHDPANLNNYDLGAPESTHLWASMYFEAADTYRPAYRAACFYGPRAIAAAAELMAPAVFTATDTDMLFPHMSRLPPLRPGQEIRYIGTDHAAKRELIAEAFARFGSPQAPPEDPDAIGSSSDIGRQFVNGHDGGQLHLRHAGQREAPAILLLHDAPGGAEALEPLIQALAATRFVIAPDLPGNGESDGFAGEQPSIDRFAGACSHLLDQLGVPSTQVFGLGFGASVAVELARTHPDQVVGVVLGGLLAATPAERRLLTADYTPRISIESDGSHWHRTWLMLRDSLVWWPWYDRRKVALRRTEEDFGAARLHRWTLDVMRRHTTYGDVVQAALAYDAVAALAEVRVPIWRLLGAPTPLAAYDDRVGEGPWQDVLLSRGDSRLAAALTGIFDRNLNIARSAQG